MYPKSKWLAGYIKAFPNGNIGDAASLEHHSGSHPVCSAISLTYARQTLSALKASGPANLTMLTPQNRQRALRTDSQVAMRKELML